MQKHHFEINISRLDLAAFSPPDEVRDVKADDFQLKIQQHRDFAQLAVNLYVYVVLPLIFIAMLIFGK